MAKRSSRILSTTVSVLSIVGSTSSASGGGKAAADGQARTHLRRGKTAREHDTKLDNDRGDIIRRRAIANDVASEQRRQRRLNTKIPTYFPTMSFTYGPTAPWTYAPTTPFPTWSPTPGGTNAPAIGGTIPPSQPPESPFPTASSDTGSPVAESTTGSPVAATTGAVPRRPPETTFDNQAIREDVLPLNKDTALLTIDEMNVEETTQFLGVPRPPYYPDFEVSHTCLDDEAYPPHFLNHVDKFFSHSQVDCCMNHFNKEGLAEEFGHCIKAAGAEVHSTTAAGMGMKMAAQHMNGAGSNNPGGGGKKPMMHHDTGWGGVGGIPWDAVNAAPVGGSPWESSPHWHVGSGWNGGSQWQGGSPWNGGSPWDGAGGKSGKGTGWNPWQAADGGKSGKGGSGWPGADPWHAASSGKSGKGSDWHGVVASWMDGKATKPSWSSHSSDSYVSSGDYTPRHRYCGISYADANSKCNAPCPSGNDEECPDGEMCFPDADACPPVMTEGGGRPGHGGEGSSSWHPWSKSAKHPKGTKLTKVKTHKTSDDWWGSGDEHDWWGGSSSKSSKSKSAKCSSMEDWLWWGGWDGDEDEDGDESWWWGGGGDRTLQEAPPPGWPWSGPSEPEGWWDSKSHKSSKSMPKSLKTPKSKSKSKAFYYDPDCFDYDDDTPHPTKSPIAGMPTYPPTKPPKMTLSPTTPPKMTISPSSSPTVTPLDLLVWGNPLSVSQPENNGNILTPLDTDTGGLAASAGSKYSIVIRATGKAHSTGFIENMDEYRGHLGLRPQDLKAGQNMFQEISRVFDPSLGGVTSPPKFKDVHAGVENQEINGDIHTILLDEDGNAWATGSNYAGQLCLGDTVDRLIPERIPMLTNIVDVAVGGAHTLLLDMEGNIWACGSNKYGQLGLGDDLANTPSPVKLNAPPGSSVSAGKAHSLVMAGGGLFVMGSNQFGQLCVDTQGNDVFTPQAFDLEGKPLARQFEATRYSSYILYVDGSVNACGRNFFGQLGDGTNEDAFVKAVQMPENHKAVRILGVGPSAYSVFFVAEDTTIWGTGLNDFGQLGVGDEMNRNVPTRVKFQYNAMVYVLSAAEDHSISLKEGGVDSIPSVPTYAPTTPYPTYSPTPGEPLPEGNDLFFWGAPEAIGQPQAAGDVTEPLNVGGGVIYSSAGTEYTIIILQDGSALSAGYIESLDVYSGHLGQDPGVVVEGVNEFRPISPPDAPKFAKAFGGVERTPNSGVMHTILLDNKGQVWATGSNSQGQLCLGDDVNRMIPERIPVDVPIVDVAIGSEHTLLLDENGNVYGCGSNAVGQLGLGLTQVTFTPTKLDILLFPVTSISSGHSHSLFVAQDGGIYYTGFNFFGQLCVDTEKEPVLSPQKLDIGNRKAIAFEAIRESSYVLFEDGSVDGCGRNNFGQLGDGTNTDATVTVVQLNGHVVRLLGVGPSSQSVFFATNDDTVLSTGLNDRGQLGVGDLENRNLPTQVNFAGPISDLTISVSDVHAITLGVQTGTFPPRVSPVPTTSPTMPDMTPAPTRQGMTLYFWGAPDSIGQENTEDQLIPVDGSGDAGVINTSGGSKYTIIVLPDGTALSAGTIDSRTNYQGHLGIEYDSVVEGVNMMQPISKVYSPDEMAIVDAPRWEHAFAGVENTPGSAVVHTILLDSEGHAWATGSNSQGQLCLGDGVEQVMIPERIPVDVRFVGVAVGGEHTLLLDEDGNVHGCGSNADGQLGLGEDVAAVSTPTKIDDLVSVSSVSAGHSHSLFMAQDGILVYTGFNFFGQLCADTGGESVYLPQPLDIGPLRKATAFEAIKESSYIIFEDGSVNACGRNNFGQLGDGTNTDNFLVVPELGDNVVRLVGVGPSAESVFFVTDDEWVWGTGLNDRGQLGVGDTENKNVPTQVKFQELVTLDLMSASGDHTVAIGMSSSGTLAPTTPPRITTASPTQSPVTVVEPTAPPTTATPSYSPTSGATVSPTVTGQDLFLWGSPESVGQASTTDVLTPLFVDENAVHLSAGSRYSLIVLRDGSALSAGFVESLENYHGQFGLDQDNVVQGVNEFRAISEVFDFTTQGTVPPKFAKAFAGVENTPESGIVHSILLDQEGRAWAMGSNSQGQLCLGIDSDDIMVPERILTDSPIVDVAIGGEHTLLLGEDGNVYGCGSNALGQLGLGEDVNSTSSPTLLDGLTSISNISAGLSHSLFEAEDGIYYTGSNEYGQLCTDTEGENVLTPQALDIGAERVATAFEAIKESSYILFEDGSVDGCGRNNVGQLGDGFNTDVITTTVLINSVVRLLGIGPSAESVFFIADDELVYGTGLNDRGQLGVGDTENKNVPTQVNFGSAVLLETLSAGQDHTLALGVETGTLAPTISGQTPFPSPAPSPNATTSDPTSAPVVEIVENPTLVPTYIIGVNITSPPNSEPSYMPTFAPTRFEDGSPTPTVATTGGTPAPVSAAEESEMLFWGAPESVGEPTSTEDVLIPTSSEVSVTDLSAGYKYTIAVLSNGTAQSAGFVESLDSYSGHLGIRGGDVVEGENSFQTIANVFDAENDLIIDAPAFVKAYTGAESASSPGAMHSLLIDADGQAWVTGSNNKGQLCLGDFEDRLLPQQVPNSIGTVVSAAVGSEHTLLLLNDGTVFGCGSNEVGQLGLGAEVTEASDPTLITGPGAVESLSAGHSFSLLKAEDGLYVVGSNQFGQLCVNTTTEDGMVDVMTPQGITDVDVSTVATFEAIKTSSYILFKDGSVGACGRNNFGQLGDGTEIDRLRTVIDPLPDELPIRQVGVGASSESAFFVNDNGDTYATGLNDRGQLGVGDNVNKNVLTLVDFDTTLEIEQISAAGDHAVARAASSST